MSRIPRPDLASQFLNEIVQVPGLHPQIGIMRVDLYRAIMDAGWDHRTADQSAYASTQRPDLTAHPQAHEIARLLWTGVDPRAVIDCHITTGEPAQ
jgi:hypothetical protein